MDIFLLRKKNLRALIGMMFAGNQKRFSEHTGIKAPQISRWLSETTTDPRNITEESARDIESKCELEPLWLDRDQDESTCTRANETSPGASRVAIRRGQFKLSAGVTGYEIEYDHNEGEPIFMARRWFEKNCYSPESLLALKVNGQSMEPSLYDGDLVIVNTNSNTPKDGVVFAVNYEGEMVIKRMRREAGQWLISSDNPNKIHFPDKLCADGCSVLGEVIYKQSERI